MGDLIQFPSMQIEDIPDDLGYIEDNQHFISYDKCYSCGKEIDFNDIQGEQIWFVSQFAGYGSKVDGSYVDIRICDTCMMEFLEKKVKVG